MPADLVVQVVGYSDIQTLGESRPRSRSDREAGKAERDDHQDNGEKSGLRRAWPGSMLLSAAFAERSYDVMSLVVMRDHARLRKIAA